MRIYLSALVVLVFLLASTALSAQYLYYPYELEEDFPALIDYKPTEAVVLQEWRRYQGGNIKKGVRLLYDAIGQLLRIEIEDGTSWEYEYTAEGKPSRITVNNTQDTLLWEYRYTKKYCLMESRDKARSQLYERNYFYYNKKGQVVEEKSFLMNPRNGKLELYKRIVRTFYSGDDDRVKAEMHYDYFKEGGKRKPLIRQRKIVFEYHPKSKKLTKELIYWSRTMKGKKPFKPESFKNVSKEIEYVYDDSGEKLMKKQMTLPIGLSEETTYHYKDDILKELNWKALNPGLFGEKGEVTEHIRQFFGDDGHLTSYQIIKEGFGSKFRSSFTIKKYQPEKHIL